MILSGKERITNVWRQKFTPVIYRRGKGYPLLMKLPYEVGNRAWLQNYGRIHPKWIAEMKCWELPQAWYNDLVNGTLTKWRKLYIIQPYREQEKCAPACWNAVGHECQCSCMGANHGSQNGGGWYIVSDTFATRWNTYELACRLLKLK